MNQWSETSIVSSKNRKVMTVVIVVFISMLVVTLCQWIFLGFYNLLELFFEAMLLLVFVERSGGRYTYEITELGLRITKQGLFDGVTYYEVPYRSIFGVYPYQQRLIEIIKFRRTYRLHSALDARDVWTIAYGIPDSNGKMENRRIYCKPSKAMLQILQEKLPTTVMTSENSVVVTMLQNN